MKRLVLITGVAGGIGEAIAKLFASQDWSVAGIDTAPAGPPFLDSYFQAELSDAGQIDEIACRLRSRVDGLHALVNNAGCLSTASALDVSLEEWDYVMAVNVRAAFFLTKVTYPLLKAACGAVVNVSSVHALATSAKMAAYAASKGALVALTRAQSIDFGPDRVRVNALIPGAVDTPMLDAGLTSGHLGNDKNLPALKRDLAERSCLGRIGTPREIAEAVYFLLDERRASFMTGQTLIIDGGALARLSTE